MGRSQEMATAGMQSLERAVGVLRAVGAAGTNGARLADVAAATGLSRSTAHRFLLSLAETGLLEQDDGGTSFRLGLELCSLGAIAGNRYELRDIAQPVMQLLAERTGDTVYLSLRDGYEAICVERIEGSFPIRTLTLEIGDRRPLGVGAGSLALLAFQPDDFVEAALAADPGAFAPYPRLDAVRLRALIAETRARGYAVNEQQVVTGMSALGAPILAPDGSAVAALSVAAISDRLGAARQEEVAAWLRDDAVELGDGLAKVIGSLTAPSVRAFARRRRT